MQRRDVAIGGGGAAVVFLALTLLGGGDPADAAESAHDFTTNPLSWVGTVVVGLAGIGWAMFKDLIGPYRSQTRDAREDADAERLRRIAVQAELDKVTRELADVRSEVRNLTAKNTARERELEAVRAEAEILRQEAEQARADAEANARRVSDLDARLQLLADREAEHEKRLARVLELLDERLSDDPPPDGVERRTASE